MYGATYGDVRYAPDDMELLSSRGSQVWPSSTDDRYMLDIRLPKLSCDAQQPSFPAIAQDTGAVHAAHDRTAPLARWTQQVTWGEVIPSLYERGRYGLFEYEEGVSTLRVTEEHILAFPYESIAGLIFDSSSSTSAVPMDIMGEAAYVTGDIMPPAYDAIAQMPPFIQAMLAPELERRLAFASVADVILGVDGADWHASPEIGDFLHEIVATLASGLVAGVPAYTPEAVEIGSRETTLVGRYDSAFGTVVTPHMGIPEFIHDEGHRYVSIYGHRHVYMWRDVCYMYWSRWDKELSNGHASALPEFPAPKLFVGTPAVILPATLAFEVKASRYRMAPPSRKGTSQLAWEEPAQYMVDLYLDAAYLGIRPRSDEEAAPIAVNMVLPVFAVSTGLEMLGTMVDGADFVHVEGAHLTPAADDVLAWAGQDLVQLAMFDGGRYADVLPGVMAGGLDAIGYEHVVPGATECFYEVLYAVLGEADETNRDDWAVGVVIDSVYGIPSNLGSPALTFESHGVPSMFGSLFAGDGAVHTPSDLLMAVLAVTHAAAPALAASNTAPVDMVKTLLTLLAPITIPGVYADVPSVAEISDWNGPTWDYAHTMAAQTSPFDGACGAAPIAAAMAEILGAVGNFGINARLSFFEQLFPALQIMLSGADIIATPVELPGALFADDPHTEDACAVPYDSAHVVHAGEVLQGELFIGNGASEHPGWLFEWRFTDADAVTRTPLWGAKPAWVSEGVLHATLAGRELSDALPAMIFDIRETYVPGTPFVDAEYAWACDDILVASVAAWSDSIAMPLTIMNVLTATGGDAYCAAGNVEAELSAHVVRCLTIPQSTYKCPKTDTGGYLWEIGPGEGPDDCGLLYDVIPLLYSVELHYDYEPDGETGLAFLF